MRKELNINFTYEQKTGSFVPDSIDYDDVNHAILANCIAKIIYMENKKLSCFSQHILDDIEGFMKEDL